MENPNPILWKGVLLMLCSSILFAFMTALTKYSHSHATSAVIFFFQSFIGFLLLSPYFFSRGISWAKQGDWHLVLLRGLLGCSSTLLLFYSLKKITLTDATLLANTSPLFVPFLAAFFLKTPLKLSIVIYALIGFSGVLIILKPTNNVFCFDALAALCGGIVTAFTTIVMKKLSKKNPKQILFGYLGLTTLLSAPFAIPDIHLLSPTELLPLIIIGLLLGLGQLCSTWAFRHAQPNVVASLSYFYVVVAVMLDWAFWHYKPGIASIIGVLLVIMGSVLMVLNSQKKQIDIIKL